jgi:putative protease
MALGVKHLRVEFLDDEPAQVARVIGLYRDVLDGRREPKGLWRELKATSKYGVTRGALAIL